MDLMRRRMRIVLLTGLLLLGWLAACTPAPSTAPLPTVPPATDAALSWHRQGGLAGFCDELSIAATGEVTVSSCRHDQPTPFRLDAAQMEKLTAWQSSFQSFQSTWRDPAQADGMTVEVTFTGTGAQPALEPDQALIADFAQNLYHEGRMGASTTAACATPPAGQQVLVDTEKGYCLYYPAAYSLIQSNPDGMEIVVDTVMNHVDPRASLTVEAANGRSLAAVVEQMIADFVQPGQAVDRHDLMIDGVPAVMLDNLLGQDVYRRVVAIQNDRLYSFFFSPIGEADTATRDQAEALYQTVIDSFRFLEETTATPANAGGAATPAPLPIPAAASVVSSTVQTIQALVDVNIRSGPGTKYGIVGSIAAGQSALVTGAMPDGSWWRVICPDDSVGNCFVINDLSLTQPTTPPGDNAPINQTGDEPTGATATYQDDEAGFAFDYHAPAWTIGETLQIGPRSYVVQMSFSDHAPEATSATYLEVAVMTWDPKRDLAGYVAVRKQAWTASGMSIIDEEARTLPGDQPAIRFLVKGTDGSQGFFLITTVGEQYLVLSGAGNVDALEEVAQTLRVQTP